MAIKKDMNILKLILVILMFLNINSFSFTRKEFNKYIQPIIEIEFKEKKVHIYSCLRPLQERQSDSFHSILLNNYDIDKNNWQSIWRSYRYNTVIYGRWHKRGITPFKMNRILRKTNKKEMKEVDVVSYNKVVISYSAPMYISAIRSDYIIELTSYCYGLCSYSYLYFVHYDRETNRIIIKDKLLNGVS